MPKQKSGKNWELSFSLEVIGGESIIDRRKAFRVIADARDWIEEVKRNTEEAGQVKEPSYRGFVYSQPTKIAGR